MAGCGVPALRGTVVSGDRASVRWVARDDPRLDVDGLASARLEAYLDPDRLTPERIGDAETDGRGRFVLPLDAPGAGVLQMTVELRAVREPDHGLATGRLDLPRAGRRLLVTLPAGGGGDLTPDPNVLQKTLDDARPFLQD